MNTKQAYINGFVKRAAEYGFNKQEAVALLKQANQFMDNVKRDLAATATMGGIGALGSMGVGALSSTLPNATTQQIDDIRSKLNIPESVSQNLGNVTNSPLSLKNNAMFEPITNSVQTSSTNMNTLPILAHEYGHANIHHNGGPVGFLQDKVYPFTGLMAGPASTASDMLLKKETNVGKGALIGAGAQAIGNAGKIIPEFEASRRGLSAINQGATMQDKIKNTATLAPGFASYLGPVAGGAVRGAMKASQNQKAQQMQPGK